MLVHEDECYVAKRHSNRLHKERYKLCHTKNGCCPSFSAFAKRKKATYLYNDMRLIYFLSMFVLFLFASIHAMPMDYSNQQLVMVVRAALNSFCWTSAGVIDQQFPRGKAMIYLVCCHSSCSLCDTNTVEIHSSLVTLWYTSGILR